MTSGADNEGGSKPETSPAEDVIDPGRTTPPGQLSAVRSDQVVPSSPAAPSLSGLSKPRILSAVLLMPAVVAVLLLGGGVLVVVGAAAAAIMSYEWCRKAAPGRWARPFGIYVFSIGLAILLQDGDASRDAFFALLVGAVLTAAWAFGSGRTQHKLLTVAGVIYIGFPCLVFVFLSNSSAFGSACLIWLFSSVWAMDIAAYLVGSRIGKRPLLAVVSPQKTWEGFLGGLMVTAIWGGCLAELLALGPFWLGLGAGAMVGVLAQAGDLAESSFKRQFGVKDMGRLIPGHGGLLDRLDSLLPVLIVAGIAGQLWAQ